MDVNAKLDIGQNLTTLLERLAQQIGTTADKVFPWYVQQAHLEGVVFFTLIATVFLVSAVAVFYGILRGDWSSGEPGNFAAVLTVMGCVCIFLTVAAAVVAGPRAATKVWNPQYHAMQMLTEDIGRLRGR